MKRLNSIHTKSAFFVREGRFLFRIFSGTHAAHEISEVSNRTGNVLVQEPTRPVFCLFKGSDLGPESEDSPTESMELEGKASVWSSEWMEHGYPISGPSSIHVGP